MTEEQQKGLATLLDRLGTNLSGLKKAVESNTNGMLAVKAAVEATGQANAKSLETLVSQNNAILTQIAILGKDISEARRDVKEVDDAVDDVRRDLTPVRGIPLPPPTPVPAPREDDSIELGVHGVKAPVKVLDRMLGALPVFVFGAIVALALLVAAVWMTGARLAVEEKPAHHAQTQQGGNP